VDRDLLVRFEGRQDHPKAPSVEENPAAKALGRELSQLAGVTDQRRGAI
jgi:hypothetical protein